MGLNVFSKKNLRDLKKKQYQRKHTYSKERKREEGTICISVRPKEDGIILIGKTEKEAII